MLEQFLGNKKILYLNDRHEEKGNEEEDRRKLYDKRILSLLDENDSAVFGKKIDEFILDYYRSLGLAKINPDNVFYCDNYLNFRSLTEAIHGNRELLAKLQAEEYEIICSYIESDAVETLSKKIKLKLVRKSDVVEYFNNKAKYREILFELGLSAIPGFAAKDLSEAKKVFINLKERGINKILLKKVRSVAGFGNFMVENLSDLEKIVSQNFKNEKVFLVEKFIENIEFSCNVQYWIDQDKIEFIVATDQAFDLDGLSHTGNIYPSRLLNGHAVNKQVFDYCDKLCGYFQQHKCFGIVGIDLIVTKTGEIYSSETNVRWNASTFPALLVRKLFGNEQVFWRSFPQKTKHSSFEDFYQEHEEFFITKNRRFGIFPIAADLIEDFNEIQLLMVADTNEKLNELYSRWSYNSLLNYR